MKLIVTNFDRCPSDAHPSTLITPWPYPCSALTATGLNTGLVIVRLFQLSKNIYNYTEWQCAIGMRKYKSIAVFLSMMHHSDQCKLTRNKSWRHHGFFIPHVLIYNARWLQEFMRQWASMKHESIRNAIKFDREHAQVMMTCIEFHSY